MRRLTATFRFQLVSLLLAAIGGGAVMSAPAPAPASQAGRAGVYVRATRLDAQTRRLYATHPLLDAVIVSAQWAEVEPRPGVYDFSRLVTEVDGWGKAGKHVVVLLSLYGQNPKRPQTPEWLYRQPDVQAIEFAGGGRAKGQQIRVPRVWEDAFVDRYLDPLVAKFAAALDGNKTVWYIMPGFGHIGNLNAQPSRGGSRAFLDAGWTPAKWQHYALRLEAVYQRYFRKTPLIVKSAAKLLRDRRQNHYSDAIPTLLKALTDRGAAFILFGLDADPAAVDSLRRRSGPALALVERGQTRMGVGDDWPLWVPPNRRNRGPTFGRDVTFLHQALANAFGGALSLPTTILYLQQPELLASHPQAAGYQPDVAKEIRAARKRLFEEDGKLAARAAR